MASQPKPKFKDEYWANRFSSGGSHYVPYYVEEYNSDVRRSIYNHRPPLVNNISLAWSLKDIPKTQYDRNNFVQGINQPVIENKSYDTTWYRNNETGYQENYVYDPSQPFPKWIHVNYGALPVVKETFSRWEISKYDPNKSYIYANGELYSTDKGFESFLEKHLSKNKVGFFEDVESFYSKKHGKTIVDRDRNVAFNPIGELVVGENITTEFIANSKNIPVLFDKFSDIQLADWRKKWYADKENEIGLDYRGRYTRALTFEEWLVNNSSKVDEDDFEFPDRSEQDFTDYLGRPVTDLDRPERIKLKNIKPLRSYVKPAKFSFDNSSWSAPLVVLDKETTDVDVTKQVVNIAGIKLRYNFSTQDIAVEDTYERWYQPNWSILGYRGMDEHSAKLKYNTSDAVRLTGLNTYQLEKQMKAQSKSIHPTFDTKEQMDFVTWAGSDSIIVGNNVGFDIDFIKKAFRTKHGFDITAIDLMELAQSTGVLRSELDDLIHKEGRKGRLTVPGLMTWLVNKNYGGEQHLAGADTVDEMKILHELLKRIQNNANQVAWGSEHGIKNLIKQGSSITSRYITHPGNIVDTIYEFDDFDNSNKTSSISNNVTVEEVIKIKNRQAKIKEIADNYGFVVEMTNKEYHELISKLSQLDDKSLAEFDREAKAAKAMSMPDIMNNNYSNFSVNRKGESDEQTDKILAAMSKVYRARTNVPRDDEKYETVYIDENKWSTDKYNPEENLSRVDDKYGKRRSWQETYELYGSDVSNLSVDEAAIEEIRTFKERIPTQYRNDFRWNKESKKWEIKKEKISLVDKVGNEYTYYREAPYYILNSHIVYAKEQMPEYGKNFTIGKKSYKVIGIDKTWEDYMAELIVEGQKKAGRFIDELDMLVKHGFLSKTKAWIEARNRAKYFSEERKFNPKTMRSFIAEIPAIKKSLFREFNLNKDIVSSRRKIDDQLAGLVTDRRLSQSTADFLKSSTMAQIDNAIKDGSMSVEKFEDIMAKFTRATHEATAAEDHRIDSIQKANKLLKKISPMYDFNNVYSATYSQINGVLGSANGVLPGVFMNPARRAGAAIINGLEVDRAKYNYYMRTANTLKGIVTMGAGIAGAFAGGPIGSAVGSSIGAGAGELGVAAYNQWLYGKEKKITTMGNILQNSFNTVGFLKSISGLDVAFSALTKTVKWATLGFIGMVTKGLHSMQSLGNPITTLSGVDYRNYQMYGRMDRMFGFAGGTINSSIENFALQQRRMYTYGQMDIDRVVAASMLGVFGSVYANGGDPKVNYEATVNKIASGGITDTKLSWAAMIDKTLPQILQIMKDMNAKTLSDVYKQSGVTFNELTDEERKRMRRVSFGYRTSLSNISTSWQRMGASLWEGGLNKIFDRVSTWIEALSQNAGVWVQKINPLIDAFDKLFTAFKSGDSESIEKAVANLKKVFGEAFEKLKEPIARMVSGISVAMLAGVQTMMPTMVKMIQSLIGEIGKFNFDKDALMYNMNYGTSLPIIRYGEQKGQIVWTGGKLNPKEEEYISWLNSQDIDMNKKRKAMKENFGPVIGLNGKRRWVSTDDYTPIAAISAAQNVIENEASNIQSGEMFNKFLDAMMKAFESFGLTINLRDDNTGNTRKLDNVTDLGAYAIQKAVSNQ